MQWSASSWVYVTTCVVALVMIVSAYLIGYRCGRRDWLLGGWGFVAEDYNWEKVHRYDVRPWRLGDPPPAPELAGKIILQAELRTLFLMDRNGPMIADPIAMIVMTLPARKEGAEQPHVALKLPLRGLEYLGVVTRNYRHKLLTHPSPKLNGTELQSDNPSIQSSE